MPAEVIVIVQKENASTRIVFACEVRGGESTNASAYDEDIHLAFNGQSIYVEARTITQ